jgi:hypothetical protein
MKTKRGPDGSEKKDQIDKQHEDDITNKRQADTKKRSTSIAKLRKRICGFSEFLKSVAQKKKGTTLLFGMIMAS